ncbi:tRNA (adenosine(37)-N6)-threonylcarbamoyltransferase complex dimerization subunit type 1 TsaB [Desulfothermus okinawensis JCM 13304]
MKKKYTLCVNSAEEWIQIAVAEYGELICGIETKSNKKGIVLIPKMIQQCLELANSHIEEIEKIACVIGPGSFTGLRISLSIVSSISITRNIPIGPINYIELLAFNGFRFIEGTIFVVQYAKIDLFNVQGFVGPEPISSITDLKVINSDQIKDIISIHDNIKVLGSGVRKSPDLFKGPHIKILDDVFDRPSLDSLAKYSENTTVSTKIPHPLYLRPSDAEQNLDKIIKNRGLGEFR